MLPTESQKVRYRPRARYTNSIDLVAEEFEFASTNRLGFLPTLTAIACPDHCARQVNIGFSLLNFLFNLGSPCQNPELMGVLHDRSGFVQGSFLQL